MDKTDIRETKETRETKEPKETRETKETKETRETMDKGGVKSKNDKFSNKTSKGGKHSALLEPTKYNFYIIKSSDAIIKIENTISEYLSLIHI